MSVIRIFKIVFSKEPSERIGRSFAKKFLVPQLENKKSGLVKSIMKGANISNNNGHRAWPPNTSNDNEVGVRFDWGEGPIKDSNGLYWKYLNLQINDNPKNQALKDAIGNKKGTHQKRMTIAVETTKDGVPVASEDDLYKEVKATVFSGMHDGGL